MTEKNAHTRQTAEQAVARTSQLQARAAEPFGSRWVSANAGTGKTHVLVQRVLRLLLAGARPDTILCLTYTNAAAAEMENRLFEHLSTWAVMSHGDLRKAVSMLLGTPPSSEDLQLARTLFATTLETAGGLKVQTIHSFCERLLRRFPLEADISPNSGLLDEAAARELKNEAIERILLRAARKPDSPLGRALSTVIAFASEDGFNIVINEALGKRALLKNIIEKETGNKDPFEGAINRLHEEFGLTKECGYDTLRNQLAATIGNEDIETVYEVLNTGKGLAAKTAERLMKARHAGSLSERIDHLHDAFLTRTHTPRKSLCAKSVRDSAPAPIEKLVKAQECFAVLWQQLRALRVVQASRALLRLSSEIMQVYTRHKVQRAQLDFDDLIEKTNWLLSKSGGASWVLYKLDSGLDHILVDEAQDTSPAQWSLISRLTEEFFAGRGSHENQPIERTVFAVGDEKQSIYSFQGAEPRLFAKMRQNMKQQAANIGHDLPLIPLTLSFRSTPAILEAVDRVFCDHENTPGISFGNETIHHGAKRLDEAGLVEIWDLEISEKQRETAVWNPLEDLQKPDDPKERLAENIALAIRGWLDNGEMLEALGRPVRPGDILILVRRRQPFTEPMMRALKRHNIPVAGADRMKVAEQIAVEDLMVLGDFLLLPEDDLALATVLKSPLFGLDDDDLFTIRREPDNPELVHTGKDGVERMKNFPLWLALKKAAAANRDERYGQAYEQLSRWLKRADKVPPFELFAGILDINNMREKLTARLGSEAGDALNEFLAMALDFDENTPPSLQEFLTHVRSTNSEIKRDMEKGINEVRIMTVHGAKGLEAEIVFLPDTTSTRSGNSSGMVQTLAARHHPPQTPDHLIWCVPGSRDVAQVAAIQEAKTSAEREEYNRLLYVAMTRARDRLYVCGWLGRNRLQDNSWYALIHKALAGRSVETNNEHGRKIWRFESGSAVAPAPGKGAGQSRTDTDMPPPAWLQQPAARSDPPMKYISPSGLLPPRLAESVGENLAEDAIDPERERLARDMGKLRGILIHALLEHLPDIARNEREKAARRVLAQKGADLPHEQRQEIIAETIRVLDTPEFAELFEENSAAERSFIAPLTNASDGQKACLSGQIDRLVVRDSEILIIDYKTGLHVPATPGEIPPAYIVQLAAYRRAIRPLFESRQIRCALLWTKSPALMWLPDPLLDDAEESLSELAKGMISGLDAAQPTA